MIITIRYLICFVVATNPTYPERVASDLTGNKNSHCVYAMQSFVQANKL